MTVRKKLDKNDLENILSYSNIVISSTSMQNLLGRQETYAEHLSKIDAFDFEKKRVSIDGQWHAYDLIVNTISPDIVMDNAYGELRFIGREFIKIVLPVEHAFPENTYFVYDTSGESFTRMVEYKKFTRHKSPHTFIGLEIPSSTNRLYPYPFKSEIARAQVYFENMPDGIISMGRAGTYKYIDIDDIIDQAMAMARQVKDGGMDHPVPLWAEWLRSAQSEMEAIAAE